jgi:1-acyl-sn-glycerol-3-phosphate acyltransferase
MKILKKYLGYVYMVYYGTIFIGLFLMLYPFLWILLSNNNTHVYADKLRKFWGTTTSILTGMVPKITYKVPLDASKQYIYCANHISYLDIVLTGGFLPTFNFFMAKMELSKVPLFNIWFKTIDVPVKRESLRNSHTAFVKAGEKLDHGASLIIFPEGRIPDNAPVMKYPLKPGAFKLAIEKGIPIVPISILDNFQRLDMDSLSMSPGKMRMVVHEPIDTKNFTEADVKEISENVYHIINNELIANNIV